VIDSTRLLLCAEPAGHLGQGYGRPPEPPRRRNACAGCGILCYDGAVKEKILKKFEEEIAQLGRELKTELPREIKRARELGDLRENAEYQAAKERQRLV
jgi:hypothetical protein